MSDEPLKLMSLDVENVLRLKAVHLTLDDTGALILEGKNEQGKSSVLRSLEILLAGGKETPDAPLHGDATKGHIIGQFGDIVVKKGFRAGKKPTLTVTTANGARMMKPQNLLDTLMDRVSLDPLKFMAKSDTEKARVLGDLMGFDESEWKQAYDELYEQRRDAKREAKRLETEFDALEHHDLPETKEVSVASLTDELQKRQERNNAIRDADKAVADHRAALAVMKGGLGNAHSKRGRLQEELDMINEDIEGRGACIKTQETELEKSTWARTKLVEADTGEITTQLAQVDSINAQVRDNKKYDEAEKHSKTADKAVAEADKGLEEVKAAWEKARSEALETLPVSGLDVKDGAVFYKGSPLSQAGSSAQLRVSVAVALATNKDKRVRLLLVDDAEKLDPDNMKVVLEMAKEAKFQVIMARVGEGSKSSVLIEDGSIIEGRG